MAPTKTQRKTSTPSSKRDSQDSSDTPPKGGSSRRSVNRLAAAGFSVAEAQETPKHLEEPAASPIEVESSQKTVEDPQVNRVRTSLQDGCAKILQASSGTFVFDQNAVSAFGVFKRSVSQSSELADDVANSLLAELFNKRIVLEFLCRMAKEKRMYSKQIKLTLDLLLKCPEWCTVWQESPQLLDSLPDNWKSNYSNYNNTLVEGEQVPASSASPPDVAELAATKMPSSTVPESPASSSKDTYKGSFHTVEEEQMDAVSKEALADAKKEDAPRTEATEGLVDAAQRITAIEEELPEKLTSVVDAALASGDSGKVVAEVVDDLTKAAAEEETSQVQEEQMDAVSKEALAETKEEDAPRVDASEDSVDAAQHSTTREEELPEKLASALDAALASGDFGKSVAEVVDDVTKVAAEEERETVEVEKKVEVGYDDAPDAEAEGGKLAEAEADVEVSAPPSVGIEADGSKCEEVRAQEVRDEVEVEQKEAELCTDVKKEGLEVEQKPDAEPVDGTSFVNNEVVSEAAGCPQGQLLHEVTCAKVPVESTEEAPIPLRKRDKEANPPLRGEVNTTPWSVLQA